MGKFIKLFISCISFLLISLYFSLVSAATIYVPTNQSTIQVAIDFAVNGDIVLVANGTYTGEGNKDLDLKGKAITLQSENSPENCIIDCEGDGFGFYFSSGEGNNFVLSGFTITNGFGLDGGGIVFNNASPTIDSCIIKGNLADAMGRGGALYCQDANPVFAIS